MMVKRKFPVLLIFMICTIQIRTAVADCELNRNCVPMASCNSVLKLSRQKPLTVNAHRFIMQSLCGISGRAIMVCCPESEAPTNFKATNQLDADLIFTQHMLD